MIDLGIVKPGATLRIPFTSFDKDDGSSITMTNFAVGDILVYKDGSTTERASTAGYTATTDFDTKTGKHLAIIDLADNTTADFFAAGSEYLVAIDAVTVDAVTTGGWIARFVIGYADAVLNTTIATLSTQTSFTLTTGPAEDDALNGCVVLIHDAASAVQFGFAVVSDYTGASKTVTLLAGTTFTAAAKDNISFFPPVNTRWYMATAQTARDLGAQLDAAVSTRLAPTVAGRTLDVTATGEAGLDFDNTVGTLAKGTDITGFNDLDAAGVRAAVGLASANLDTQLDALPTAAENADAVWDEDATAHQTGGTFGAAIGDPGASTETIFGAVVTDAAAATVGADTTLLLSRLGVPSNLGGGATVAANLSDIEGQTDDIGVAGAGLTALGDARIANLDATISSRATPAQVNAEVVDVLTVDTFAQPGQETPAATNTLAVMIRYLFKLFRNKKEQTSSEFRLFNDGGTVVDHKQAVSDDGVTATRGQMATGP